MLTVAMALIAIVSWVVRSLLGDMQGQLRGISSQLAGAIAGRGDSMREVQEMLDQARRDTDDRIERPTRAVELSARADLLRLVAAPEVRQEIKEQARHII